MKRTMAWAVIASLLMSCFVSVAVARFIHETRDGADPAGWITIARVAAAVLALSGAMYMFFMERQILAQRDQLNEKGQDHEFIILLSGSGVFFAPVCYAVILQQFGAPLTDVYLCAPVSFLGVSWWAWRKRAYLVGSDRAPKNTPEVTFARSYTVMLAILGGFAFLVIVLEILSLLFSPEGSSTAITPALVIIPFMVFLCAGCWTTVSLRNRRSPHAVSATKIVSICVLPGFPALGLVAFVYWLLWVRKKERPSHPVPLADPEF